MTDKQAPAHPRGHKARRRSPSAAAVDRRQSPTRQFAVVDAGWGFFPLQPGTRRSEWDGKLIEFHYAASLQCRFRQMNVPETVKGSLNSFR
jgi:hypothetical protein